MYPLTMPSIRGGILGWNIDIYSTRTDQFDWSVSRAYVINIYIYIWTPIPITLPRSHCTCGVIIHNRNDTSIFLMQWRWCALHSIILESEREDFSMWVQVFYRVLFKAVTLLGEYKDGIHIFIF